MKKSKSGKRSGLASLGGMLLSALLLAVPVMSAEEAANTTFDNLVPVKDPKVSMAYIDPDADFSVFKRVAIIEPFVAFRSNWQRDQNRSRCSHTLHSTV